MSRSTLDALIATIATGVKNTALKLRTVHTAQADYVDQSIAARANPRVLAVTSSATVTPNADSYDAVSITAQAVGLTLANWTGTPLNMQAMVIRINDNGSAQSIAYGPQYRALGVTLPTTTIANKTLYLACIWNALDTKIDVIGTPVQA